MIKKILGCKINSEKSSTAIEGKHTACFWSISTVCAFGDEENKHDIYKTEDFMENFCHDVKMHAIESINYG